MPAITDPTEPPLESHVDGEQRAHLEVHVVQHSPSKTGLFSSGLATRLFRYLRPRPARPIDNRPQVTNLPHLEPE